jgi:hypothetical protein
MLLLGLGFTALGSVFGVVIAVVVGAKSLGDWVFAISLATGATGAAGFAPLFLLILGCPWRYLVALRIDDHGFSIEDSGGKGFAMGWQDPGLAFTTRETVDAPADSLAAVPGEALMVVPRGVTGRIGPEARAALFESAAAHGLVVLEEEYLGRDTDRRAPSVHVVARSAARPAFDGSVEPARLGMSRFPEACPPGNAFATFDVTAVHPPAYMTGGAARGNELRQVPVSKEGLDLVDARGRSFRQPWAAGTVKIDMMRRLASLVDPLDAPNGAWHLQVGPARVKGYIDGECYATIRSAAHAAGLEVVTGRFPGNRVWVASTEIRARPPLK